MPGQDPSRRAKAIFVAGDPLPYAHGSESGVFYLFVQRRSSRRVVKLGRRQRPHFDDLSLTALLTTNTVANRKTIRDQTPSLAVGGRRDLEFRIPCIAFCKVGPNLLDLQPHLAV